MPSRPWRLVIYWLIATMMFFAVMSAEFFTIYIYRGWWQWNMTLDSKFWTIALKQYFSPQRFTRRTPPQVIDLWPTMAIYVAWPFATFITLMIFQQSMKHAKIRPIHVLRCVLYSCDLMWVATTVVYFLSWRIPTYGYENIVWSMLILRPLCVAAIFVFAALTGYRLACAYKYYLRFDHSFWTVVTSQVILLMIAIIILLALPKI